MRRHHLRSLHSLLNQANTWHDQFKTNRQSEEPYRINENQWVNSRKKLCGRFFRVLWVAPEYKTVLAQKKLRLHLETLGIRCFLSTFKKMPDHYSHLDGFESIFSLKLECH